MLVSIREFPSENVVVPVRNNDYQKQQQKQKMNTRISESPSEEEEERQQLLQQETFVTIPFHLEYLVDTSSTATTTTTTCIPRTVATTTKRTKTSRNSLPSMTTILLLLHNIQDRMTKIFIDLFLPLGYPQSVDPSYLPYQVYDGIQGLCSYWRGVVTTRAVLEAAGVGDSEATAASAAIQWAVRDGTGMIGGLGFSYLSSSYFDTHVKEFRLFADIINDVALTLDMIAPHLNPPHWRLYILSISTICKTMCGISAGATKGRITQHFSRQGNMADLTAKESTQETLVSLLGMIGGVWMAHLLQHVSYTVTWFLFGILTLLHVWANYKAVKLLKLTTINPERIYEMTKDVLKVLQQQEEQQDTPNRHHHLLIDTVYRMPSPDQMDESLMGSTKTLFFPRIQVYPNSIQNEHFAFADLFTNQKYIIGIQKKNDIVVIHLILGATIDDELTAYIHGIVLYEMIQKNRKTSSINHRSLMER